eukprot:1080987-Pyramimonas_sp.AAC.1
MDLEAVKYIVKGLMHHSGEGAAEAKYQTLYRGGFGMAVRSKVSTSHQKKARSWGKTAMKFKKKNIFVSIHCLTLEQQYIFLSHPFGRGAY